MKFKYRLPFKTRLMLWMIAPFRERSEGPLSEKGIRKGRKPVPKFFLSTWVLGKQAKLLSVKDQLIPVRDAEIRVRIYRPSMEKNLPLIMNYHGGGWVVGTLQNNDYYCSVLAKEVNALVISVDYRLAPDFKFPTGLYDCFDALQWAVANAEMLGIDRENICVTGDSAGGNLSAALAIKSRDLNGPKIKFQALIYPATDSRMGYESLKKHANAPILTKKDVEHYLDFYIQHEKDLHSPLLSPYLAESLEHLPPALIVTAGYDPLCDDGTQYAERLKAEGVEVEVLHYPEDLHGFFTFPNHSKSGKAAIYETAKRIKAKLR